MNDQILDLYKNKLKKLTLKYKKETKELKLKLTLSVETLKIISKGASKTGPLKDFPEPMLEMARLAHEVLEKMRAK